MRAATAMLLFTVGTGASVAQPYTAADGFAICPYANGTIGTCAPLTEKAMQDYRLSPAQIGVVAILRATAGKPEASQVDALVNSNHFAPPQQFAQMDEYSDLWFPDPSSANVECGIHFRLAKEDLLQITYAVDGQFIVLWTRVAVTAPH